MKILKIIVFIWLAILLHLPVVGQTQMKSFKVVERLSHLEIGSKFPDLEFSNAFYHSKPTLRLSDFKGKAVIIDIWAPWCSPCLSSLPKIDTLQKEFQNDLQFVLITREGKEFSKKTYETVTSRKQLAKLPVIVEDSLISFIPRVIPHYIWIDKNGTIKGITGSDELTGTNIRKLITGDNLDLKLKEDLIFESADHPMFSEGSRYTKDELLFNSVLTKFIQGYSTNCTRGVDWNWVRCTRHPIILLYKVAMGKFGMEFMNNNRVILEGFSSLEDSLKIGFFTDKTVSLWSSIQTQHFYNYELVVPEDYFKQATSKEDKRNVLFSYMQQDINRYFSPLGFTGSIEKRSKKILTLVRTSELDKIKSKEGEIKDECNPYFLDIRNRPLVKVIEKFQGLFFKEDALPIQDDTHYSGMVDITINADLENIQEVNKELDKYDLQLIEKYKDIDMVVIKKIRTP
jgi:thiol-disulfide isomerase/thioredoxin